MRPPIVGDKVSDVDADPGDPAGVLRVERLESLSPADLHGVEAIVYGCKGVASHIEVICRIKGIELLPADPAEDVILSPDNTTAFLAHDGGFQVSASGAAELEQVDFSRVRTVFVRLEHLLYDAVWADSAILEPRNRSTLRGRLLDQLLEIATRVPESVGLVVRGLDVRSDDVLLGGALNPVAEANPELGFHGAGWLLTHPEWVDLEGQVVAGLNRPVEYGVPFVRSLEQYERFRDTYGRVLPGLVPFLETPSALDEFSSPDVDSMQRISIGLKDVGQFYFAADRGNAQLTPHIDYGAPTLVSWVARVVDALTEMGNVVTLFQSPGNFAIYSDRITTRAWVASMAAGEFARMEVTHG